MTDGFRKPPSEDLEGLKRDGIAVLERTIEELKRGELEGLIVITTKKHEGSVKPMAAVNIAVGYFAPKLASVLANACDAAKAAIIRPDN